MPTTKQLSSIIQATEPIARQRLNGLSGIHKSKEKNGFHPELNTGSEAGKFVSEEAYLLHYADHPDFNYEWNNGILEEKPVSTIAQFKLYFWFIQILSCYLEINHFAESAMFEFLTKMPLENKSVKRKPDLLLVRNDNPNPLRDEDSSYSGVCDLCVELLSMSSQGEIERDITDKKAEYAEAGVREYIILDRTGEHMEFYRLSSLGNYEEVQPDADGVIHSEVLPGFQFRWDDLYRRPTLNELVSDPVYNAFVIPKYQELQQYAEAEHLRAEEAEMLTQQAQQRAEQETQRTQQEAQRAQQAEELVTRLEAQIRALGFEPV